MSETTTNGGGCLGLLAVLLTVLFVGLKLAEVGVVATWSWWLVLSPLWIYGIIVIGFIIIALLVLLAIFLLDR